MKKWNSLIFLLILISLSGCTLNPWAPKRSPQKSIIIFAGSVSKPPLEEVAKVFEKKTGVKVELNFGGSGVMLSQMIVSGKGDLYLPASQDFMEKAERAGIINFRSRKIVAYLTPAIIVRKGNPKKIKSLQDLARPGVKVGIADPDTVVIGLFTREIFEEAEKKWPGFELAIRKNITAQARSAADLAGILILGQVDAIINWSVLRNWHPDIVEAIMLKPDQIPRAGYIPLGLTKFAKEHEAAQDFIDFITSSQGRSIFKKHGYIVERGEVKEVAPKSKI